MLLSNSVDVFLLGCVCGILVNYGRLIHAYDSYDVVRTVFLEESECYMYKTVKVDC